MTPADVLRRAHEVGLTVRIAPSGNLLAAPADRLTPELRGLLVNHKPALLDYIREVEGAADELIKAAMLACDHHGDGPAAREEMRQTCLATPAHLRADLLVHLQTVYERGPTTYGVQP